MAIVRTFFVDQFRIPSPSMEKSLLVGDYLFVSKLHYGPRLPMSICVPYTDWCVPGVTLPYVRLPGFDDLDRGDEVVFNWPPSEKPIDRKVHYIKRAVGLPGETLEVRDKVVYHDGEPYPLQPTMQQLWNVEKEEASYQLSGARLSDLGVDRIMRTGEAGTVRVQATTAAAKAIRSWPWIASVEPYVQEQRRAYGPSLFPSGRHYTRDNFGPVTIPEEGMTVELNEKTWPVYRKVIDDYEHRAARRLGPGRYEIDGEIVSEYTFRQDYFFAMGDNRDDSQDSRFWGFVPMDHLVGKAVMVYFSWDEDAGWMGLPRFGRTFHTLD